MGDELCCDIDFNEDSVLEIDPETAWLELPVGDFRVWHIMFFCFAALLALIIMCCCCMKFRIPRTKQEIEADYQRKLISDKFKEKLSHIKNTEMNEMDLPKALVKIQEEFLSEESSCSDSKENNKKLNNFDKRIKV